MIKTLLSFVAEAIVIDRDTSVVSAYNLMDELHTQALPALVPKLAFYTALERDIKKDPSDVDITVRIRLDTEILGEWPIRVGFEGKARARANVRVNGMTLKRPGVLELSLLYKKKVLAQYRIPVVVPPPQTSAGDDPAPQNRFGAIPPKRRKPAGRSRRR